MRRPTAEVRRLRRWPLVRTVPSSVCRLTHAFGQESSTRKIPECHRHPCAAPGTYCGRYQVPATWYPRHRDPPPGVAPSAPLRGRRCDFGPDDVGRRQRVVRRSAFDSRRDAVSSWRSTSCNSMPISSSSPAWRASAPSRSHEVVERRRQGSEGTDVEGHGHPNRWPDQGVVTVPSHDRIAPDRHRCIAHQLTRRTCSCCNASTCVDTAHELPDRLPRPTLDGDEPVADGARHRSPGSAPRATRSLRELTERFDGVALESRAGVRRRSRRRRRRRSTPELRAALDTAIANVTVFHEHQRRAPETLESRGHDHLGVPRPMRRAGVYVPGGRAVYPSTVLMTAVPARVAGVGPVVLCVPPDRERRRAPHRAGRRRLAGVDEVYRVGGAQAIAAMAYGTESHRAGRRHRRPGQRLRGRGQARGRRRRSGSPRRSPGRPRSSSSPTTPPTRRLRGHRPHGAGRARSRRPGLARHLGRPAVADAVERRRRASSLAEAPRAGRHRGHPRRRAATPRSSTDPRQRLAVVDAIAPEHLELHDRRRRGVRCRWCATPVRCSAARGRRRRSATTSPGPSHVLPTDGTGPVRRARSPSTTSASTSTSSRSTEPGWHGSARTVVALAEAEGLAAHAESVALRLRRTSATVSAGTRSGSATTSPRSRATTRPRSTSRCGSTPTSRPAPPPAAFVDARRRGRGRRRLAPLPRPGGHRAARARSPPLHGVARRAGLRRQRLQRGAADPPAHLRRAGPHRSPPSSPPTRCTRHIARITGATAVVEGERADDFALDLDEVERVLDRQRPVGHVPVLAEQPDRHRRAEADRARGARHGRRGRRPARGRRGLRPVRPVVGAGLVADDAPARGHPHLLQDLVDGRGPARLPASAPPGSSPSSTRSCCRTTSTPSSRSPGALALDFVDEMEERVSHDRRGAGPPRGRAASSCGVEVWPSGANFVLFRPDARRRRRRSGRGWSTARVLVRNCSGVAAPRRAACGSPSAPPTRTTRSSPPCDGDPVRGATP